MHSIYRLKSLHDILFLRFFPNLPSPRSICVFGEIGWKEFGWASYLAYPLWRFGKSEFVFAYWDIFCCESFRYRMFCFLFRTRRYINKSFYKIIFDERPYCLWRNVWSGRPIGILLMCSRMGTFACCLLCILIINIILTENYLKSGDYWGFIFAIAFNWQLSFLFLHNSRHIWICNIYLCEYLC